MDFIVIEKTIELTDVQNTDTDTLQDRSVQSVSWGMFTALGQFFATLDFS